MTFQLLMPLGASKGIQFFGGKNTLREHRLNIYGHVMGKKITSERPCPISHISSLQNPVSVTEK